MMNICALCRKQQQKVLQQLLQLVMMLIQKADNPYGMVGSAASHPPSCNLTSLFAQAQAVNFPPASA